MELVIFLAGIGLGGIIGYCISLNKIVEKQKKEIIEDILEDLKDIRLECNSMIDVIKDMREVIKNNNN